MIVNIKHISADPPYIYQGPVKYFGLRQNLSKSDQNLYSHIKLTGIFVWKIQNDIPSEVKLDQYDIVFVKHGQGIIQTLTVENIIQGYWNDDKLEGTVKIFEGNCDKLGEIKNFRSLEMKNGLILSQEPD